MSERNIVISTRTITIFLTLAAAIWLLVQIKGILLGLFVAVILSLGLEPLVEFLVKKRFPRGLAVLGVFVLIITALVGLGTFTFSPMIEQTKKLFTSFPRVVDSVIQHPQAQDYVKHFEEAISQQITKTSGSVLRATLGAFTGIAYLLTVLIITAYLLLDFNRVKKTILGFFPKKDRREVEKTILEIEKQLGGWFRGQFILMVVVGVSVWLGLTLMRVDFAISLGLLAGLLEIVPLVGSTLAGVPAAIIGFSQSNLLGVGVIALFIVIQQLENNLLVPKVMQKTVGLNPLVTLLALLIGGKLFGIIGALLAIPATLTGIIIIKHLLDHER